MTPTAAARTLPATVGALRASGWKSRSVKDEIRAKQCREKLLKDKLFAGLEFQKRAIREEKP